MTTVRSFSQIFRKLSIDKMPYYAVRTGRNPGVYNSWSDCQDQVDHYSGAKFQKFDSAQAASDFASGGGSSGYSSGSSGYSSGSSGHSSGSTGRSSGSYASVYTDGACLRNGQSGSQTGVGVYWGEGDSRNVSERHYGRQTNNSAEIEAATRAIEQAGQHGVPNLRVNTDSQFLVNGATKWMPKWKENGWQTSSGEPVKNRDDFERLDSAMRNSNVNVDFRHVSGHAGVRGNEAADRLANQGARKY